MADTAQEKTEQATARRRTEARRKGTVAKSQDLTGAIMLIAVVAMMPTAIAALGNGFSQSVTLGLRRLPTDVDIGRIGAYVINVLRPTLLGLAYVIGTALLAGLAANFGQVGLVMSGEALNPSLARLNPLNGLKRLFSFSATFQGLKALAKCLLFGWIAYNAIVSGFPSLVGSARLQPAAGIGVVADLIKSVAMRIGVVWLVMAAIDYFVQKKNIDKQLRMSKQEVRQEMKDQETSPELRAAIGQRRRKLMRAKMRAAVAMADAIITNPTHYAVAISYDVKSQHAPIVVFKGVDLLAARMREVAAEHRIPIVPNPPLARALYKKCEIGDYVPREMFQAVAEVLAYVYRTVKKIKP